MKERRFVYSFGGQVSIAKDPLAEISQSLLIQKAISLYKTTHALTSPDATLEIAHPGQALLPNPELGADFRLVTQNNSVSSRANGRSYSSTTHTTVLSIIEKIGSDQCRNLLNEMEKCLIARAQAFDLLVSAFLFFACVERLEWAFRRHEAEVSSGKVWTPLTPLLALSHPIFRSSFWRRASPSVRFHNVSH